MATAYSTSETMHFSSWPLRWPNYF